MTTIPESKSARNCDIFNSARGMLDLVYKGSPWHGAAKSENLGGNKIFENAECENNFKVEKVGPKHSVIFNHKDSNWIHVDPNHTTPNQPIPSNSTNNGSINDLDDISAIEKIFSSPVNLMHTPSPLPVPQIFTYGTASDPQSPPYDSSAESVTPKGNNTPHKDPTNPVRNVPDDPSSSDSSSLDSSDSSDD